MYNVHDCDHCAFDTNQQKPKFGYCLNSKGISSSQDPFRGAAIDKRQPQGI